MTRTAQKPARRGAGMSLRVRGRMESEIAAKKELILGDTKHDEHAH